MGKFLVLLLFVGLLIVPLSTHAQTDEPPIIRNEAIVNYPQSVNFQLEVDPAVNIVDAVLNYDVTQTACLDVNTQVPVTVAGSLIEWEWPMVRSGNPPPGTELWWEWTLTDDQGNVTTTSRQTLTFSDDRFDWQTVQAGNVTLHWYAGDDVGLVAVDLLHLYAHGVSVREFHFTAVHHPDYPALEPWRGLDPLHRGA